MSVVDGVIGTSKAKDGSAHKLQDVHPQVVRQAFLHLHWQDGFAHVLDEPMLVVQVVGDDFAKHDVAVLGDALRLIRGLDVRIHVFCDAGALLARHNALQ